MAFSKTPLHICKKSVRFTQVIKEVIDGYQDF
ncbi:hypothetical protein HMPREF9306_01786 [Propionimicrobium lymphophilum ACS-093-V-SCH5]|uniref:Uncharacterized protein n=1 Tax=Propionimicrobium lymphophilum ACS-093-V-SCH5 TaxID=883161 RepID=S2WHZ9_9ACTN|nr:hypothetical protein HMPREF9306_01786 [Propionimicrobium lymphophilum ACS-093-V-SCH5]